MLNLFKIILIFFSAIIYSQSSFGKEVNVYSYRQPILINPFFEEFTKNTGIKVNVLHAKKGLLERLKAEGVDTPADVVLTVDISRLNQFVENDVLQPIESSILESNIPSHLRDTNNRWFSFSKRARIVVISKERVDPKSIKRIEDLSKSEWKGKICTRKGSHVYNRSLLASIIAIHFRSPCWTHGFARTGIAETNLDFSGGMAHGSIAGFSWPRVGCSWGGFDRGRVKNLTK